MFNAVSHFFTPINIVSQRIIFVLIQLQLTRAQKNPGDYACRPGLLISLGSPGRFSQTFQDVKESCLVGNVRFLAINNKLALLYKLA